MNKKTKPARRPWQVFLFINSCCGQGTKFYGLNIGCGVLYDSFYERSYERLLDKMWVVNV